MGDWLLRKPWGCKDDCPMRRSEFVATGERTIIWLGTASSERGEAKIDQLIDGPLCFLGAIDHEPRIIKLQASAAHPNRLTFAIFDVKLSTAIAWDMILVSDFSIFW